MTTLYKEERTVGDKIPMGQPFYNVSQRLTDKINAMTPSDKALLEEIAFYSNNFTDFSRYVYGLKPVGVYGTGNYKVFYSNGVFTPPANVDKIRVRVIGAGGGGGCNDGSTYSGGGGGGGGYAEAEIDISSYHTTTFPITVGKGGSGGSVGDLYGSGGGTSSFGTILTATGGGGGRVQGGAGGQGSGGTINSNGGNGGSSATSYQAGGGGGGGSELGNGGNGGGFSVNSITGAGGGGGLRGDGGSFEDIIFSTIKAQAKQGGGGGIFGSAKGGKGGSLFKNAEYPLTTIYTDNVISQTWSPLPAYQTGYPTLYYQPKSPVERAGAFENMEDAQKDGDTANFTYDYAYREGQVQEATTGDYKPGFYYPRFGFSDNFGCAGNPYTRKEAGWGGGGSSYITHLTTVQSMPDPLGAENENIYTHRGGYGGGGAGYYSTGYSPVYAVVKEGVGTHSYPSYLSADIGLDYSGGVGGGGGGMVAYDTATTTYYVNSAGTTATYVLGNLIAGKVNNFELVYLAGSSVVQSKFTNTYENLSTFKNNGGIGGGGGGVAANSSAVFYINFVWNNASYPLSIFSNQSYRTSSYGYYGRAGNGGNGLVIVEW